MRAGRELPALLEAERRPRVPPGAERRSPGAERPGHDQDVARPRACPAGNAGGAADRRHAQQEPVGGGRVTADHGHACLAEALIQLHYVGDSRLGRRRKCDHEPFGLRAGRREVAEVDRSGAEPELAPGDPVEAKVDALDQRVLGDDAPSGQLGRVVLDPHREAALLELGEQAELADVTEPHGSPARRRDRRRSRSPAGPARPHARPRQRLRREPLPPGTALEPGRR